MLLQHGGNGDGLSPVAAGEVHAANRAVDGDPEEREDL